MDVRVLILTYFNNLLKCILSTNKKGKQMNKTHGPGNIQVYKIEPKDIVIETRKTNKTSDNPWVQYLADSNIHIDCTPIAHDMKAWETGHTDKWAVIVKNGKNTEMFEYSQGIGHRHVRAHFDFEFLPNRPHIADVIHSLVSDYQCFLDFPDMLDFIQEMGYSDLKEGRRVFNLIQVNAEKMKELFSKEELEKMSELSRVW